MTSRRISTPKLLTIGEALFDIMPNGEVHLGGAPLNVALHASQLGAKSYIWSAVGRDTLGQTLIQTLEKNSIQTQWLSENADLETGVVQVMVDPQTGEPSYHIKENTAWDELEWHDNLIEDIGEFDAITWGSLCLRTSHNQAIINALWHHLNQRRLQKLKIPICVFDINLRPPFIDWSIIEMSMDAADALKVNHEEWALLCPRFLSRNQEIPDQQDPQTQELIEARAMMARFDLAWIAITHGAQGLSLHHRDGSLQACGPVAKGGDRVGAGDATNAALIVSLIKGYSWEDCAQIAAQCGAFVASQHGATPALPDELKSP